MCGADPAAIEVLAAEVVASWRPTPLAEENGANGPWQSRLHEGIVVTDAADDTLDVLVAERAAQLHNSISAADRAVTNSEAAPLASRASLPHLLLRRVTAPPVPSASDRAMQAAARAGRAFSRSLHGLSPLATDANAASSERVLSRASSLYATNGAQIETSASLRDPPAAGGAVVSSRTSACCAVPLTPHTEVTVLSTGASAVRPNGADRRETGPCAELTPSAESPRAASDSTGPEKLTLSAPATRAGAAPVDVGTMQRPPERSKGFDRCPWGAAAPLHSSASYVGPDARNAASLEPRHAQRVAPTVRAPWWCCFAS